MKPKRKQVLEQLSEPQQAVSKVLTERWPEVKAVCDYENEDNICPKNKIECSFSNCPKLASDENASH